MTAFLLGLLYAKLKCCSVSDWEKMFAMEIMGTGGYWLQVGGLIIVDALQAKMLAIAGRKLAPLFCWWTIKSSLVGRLFSAITNKPSLYWLCRVRQSRRRSNITTTSHSAQYSEEAAKSRKQPKSWKQWDQRHNSHSLQKVTGLWVRAQLGDAKLELLCWELGRGLQRRVTTHGAGQLDTAWYSWPHPPLHITTQQEENLAELRNITICMTWQCSVDVPVTVPCLACCFQLLELNEMWLRPPVPATISAMMMIGTLYPDE